MKPIVKTDKELVRGHAGDYYKLNNGIKECVVCGQLWACDLIYCPYCHVSREARVAHIMNEEKLRNETT